MNIGLIFAGGTGVRMNSKGKPKQFLEIYGKPIIVYTLEVFENHSDIDKIIVVCIEEYIDELKKIIEKYRLQKIFSVVAGGATGFDSIFNGLAALENVCEGDDIVLIHDGVRPLIDGQTISENIKCAKKHGNAITSVPAVEGIMVSSDGATVDDFPDRKVLYTTKAPQSFRFRVIYDLYKKARQDNFVSIESAYLAHRYGVKLHIVKGSYNNIKVTTPTDYYILRAILENIENAQIEGY